MSLDIQYEEIDPLWEREDRVYAYGDSATIINLDRNYAILLFDRGTEETVPVNRLTRIKGEAR